MKIELVRTAEQAAEWDRYVVSHPDGTHFHLTWWMQNQHVPMLTTSVLAARENGAIVGGAMLCHFSPLRLAGDITLAPHSPIAEAHRPDVVRAVVDAVVAQGRRRRSLLVQFEGFTAEVLDPLREATRSFRTEEEPIWKLYHPGVWRDLRVTLRDRSEDDILKSFASDTRQRIRQALRRGYEVAKCRTEADLRTGYEVWSESARHNQYTPRTWSAFQKLHDAGTAVGMAWADLCRFENKPVGFSFNAASGRGFDQVVLAHRPVPEAGPVPRVLNWHGILEARARGMDYFSFGAPMRGSNTRFKESFSPVLVDNTRFVSVILRPRSLRLIRRWISRTDLVERFKRWVSRRSGETPPASSPAAAAESEASVEHSPGLEPVEASGEQAPSA